MFHLRRAAARALSQSAVLKQPSQFATFAATRPAVAKTPSLARSFHQSLRWGAETTDAESKSTSETEPLAEDVKDIGEASIGTPEEQQASSAGADAVAESSGTTSEPLGQSQAQSGSQSASLAEKAKDSASSVAETVSNVAKSAAASVTGGAPAEWPPRAAPGDRQVTGTFAEPRQSRIIYVGNLFFEVTAPQLEKEFSKRGEVTNSRIITDNQGLSKGFGYLEFATQEQADRAVQECDQMVFQGRRMAVQYHQRRPAREGRSDRASSRPYKEPQAPSNTLFIGNMSYQMSDRDLNDLFRGIEGVLDVRVAIDRRSGQPRGFAHADFASVEGATSAKEFLERKVVYGRQLKIDYSAARTPRQFE